MGSKSYPPVQVHEQNMIRKEWGENQLRIALISPNVYEGGMSGYTLQALYGLWNARDDVVCERAFLPYHALQVAFHTSSPGKELSPVRTMESNRPLKDFDWLAFSLHYELDYPHMLWILENAGIPLTHKLRFDAMENGENNDAPYPLILAGGAPFRSNPLPVIPFLDLGFIGEVEPLWDVTVDYWMQLLRSHPSRAQCVRQFCTDVVNKTGRVGWWNPHDTRETIPLVRRCWASDLDKLFHPTTQIIPRFSPASANPLDFGETLFLEVNRGCPHGCRFCMTGHQAKPFRNRSLAALTEIIAESITNTAVRHFTLIGASVTDHPEFEQLCRVLLKEGCTFTVPSVRVDTITPNVASLLVEGGMRTVAIAPETGSDSLRRRMNKRLTNSQILTGCQILKKAGISNLKLYFLYGLPFETPDDADAIVSLTKEIADLGFDKWGLRVSLNPLIPKAHTPFERYTEHYSEPRFKFLTDQYKRIENSLKGDRRIKFESLDLDESYLQTVFSLGDENFGDLVEKCYRGGLKPKSWLNLLRREYSDMIADYFDSLQNRSHTSLPWGKLDLGIKPTFLDQEWARTTEDKFGISCNDGCTICGCCDPKEI